MLKKAKEIIKTAVSVLSTYEIKAFEAGISTFEATKIGGEIRAQIMKIGLV